MWSFRGGECEGERRRTVTVIYILYLAPGKQLVRTQVPVSSAKERPGRTPVKRSSVKAEPLAPGAWADKHSRCRKGLLMDV